MNRLRWWLIDRLLQPELLDLDELPPQDRMNLSLLYRDDFYRSLKKLQKKDQYNIAKQALASQSMRDVDVSKGQMRTWIRLEATLKRLALEYERKKRK
jgi:hypothetical protein